MTNLTKDEYARLHLKAKRGMLTAEERAALEAYEAAAQPAPQTPVPADTETLLCCPYCGHATITTQIVSDVTYRKPATVIAMMFAPLIAVVLAFLLRNMFVTVLALIVVIVSALVPMWAFYRGNYSVTHKYYVCKRCGYAERDTKWKIVNDGGKAIEAVAMGIGLTLVLIFSVFMISKNVDFSSMPTWDIPAVEDTNGGNVQGTDGGGEQTIEDLGDGTILMYGDMPISD